MLKPSRTWPSIIQKTMAVVQLRFDGKYAYSTIANINQLQKLQNQTSITSCDREEDSDEKGDKFECICGQSGDLPKCGSYAMTSRQTDNYCSHMNGRSAATSSVGKVFLCDIAKSAVEKKRKRSESIKVDNWDFIYRENPFQNLPNDGEKNAAHRSPQNGFRCDHGYLSGRGAQKLDTIFRHYYPESGFGWIVLLVAVIVAIITHGFQLSAVIFLLPTIQRFNVSEVECLGE